MVNGGGGGGLVFFGWPTVPVPPRFIESRWDSARPSRGIDSELDNDNHRWTDGPGTEYNQMNIYIYIYRIKRKNVRIAKNLSTG